MRGMQQQAKPDVACPLDGRVRDSLKKVHDYCMPNVDER
jgi:hypothetical protein